MLGALLLYVLDAETTEALPEGGKPRKLDSIGIKLAARKMWWWVLENEYSWVQSLYLTWRSRASRALY